MKRPFFMCALAFCLIVLFAGRTQANNHSDSVLIRVHFLHGSKPKHQYRHVEDRWFGGILGGHVGIEYEPGKIIDFVPRARFHIWSNRYIINSHFVLHDTISFYSILGGHPDSAKKTVITIPISKEQKQLLDTIASRYLQRAPYDYAFFGMRCGAMTADILSQIGITRQYSFRNTYRHTFYPRILRRRLERMAHDCHYVVYKREGSKRRIWEAD